jgi:signal transduction histidine kinase
MIDDLLDFNRIIAGKLQLNSDDIDMQELIESTVMSLAPAAETRQLKVKTHLESGIVINGDRMRLQQVISNLLTNAFKFTPDHGTISIHARRNDDWVVIRIADTGRGISADFLPHVFERFHQGDGIGSKRQGGLGLGLAIVRHLVEMHGGRISAESAGANKGATFTVELPVGMEPPPRETTFMPSSSIPKPSI